MEKRKIIFIALFASLLMATVLPVKGENRKTYIRQYKALAIREMERTGIPASIKLAQGILESGCGTSELAVYANNHFGIKCHDWEGKTYTMDDDRRNECFRKYETPEESWIDHSEFLMSRPRYAGLFHLKTTDYKAWAKGLKAAGYATNPLYAHQLIKIIEEEGLSQYDRVIDHPTGGKGDPTPAVPETVAEEIGQEREESRPAGNSFDYSRREEMRNGIPCIEIVPGDTFYKIATYYDIKVEKLMKFNDKTDNDLYVGDIVYLKRKRGRAARGYEYHRVKAGDTPYSIAQEYGIRLKNLCHNNFITEDEALVEGEKIYLRKRATVF